MKILKKKKMEKKEKMEDEYTIVYSLYPEYKPRNIAISILERYYPNHNQNSRLPSDILIYILTFLVDVYVEMYDEQHIKRVKPMFDNKTHGTWRFWHHNGQILHEDNFADSMFDGVCTGWFSSGKVWYIHPYQAGKVHGNALAYHSNGRIQKRYSYIQGKLDGLQYEYTRTGFLQNKVEYRAGKKHGMDRVMWGHSIERIVLFLDGERVDSRL